LEIVLAAATTAPRTGKRVFITGIVAGGAYVAFSIARFVSVEVVELCFAAAGQGTVVPVVGIKPVVHMAVKAVGSVEPGTGSQEHSAGKPIWAIVAVGRAVVRGIVKVTVGANGRDTDANVDANLS